MKTKIYKEDGVYEIDITGAGSIDGIYLVTQSTYYIQPDTTLRIITGENLELAAQVIAEDILEGRLTDPRTGRVISKDEPIYIIDGMGKIYSIKIAKKLRSW